MLLLDESLLKKILGLKVSILYLPVTIIRLMKSLFQNKKFQTKYLKTFIKESQSHTLEHLIIKTSNALEKKFKIKKVKITINKTAVAKKYGAESLSVSNWNNNRTWLKSR